jgi:hypothetical protein
VHATPWGRIVVQRNRAPMMRRSPSENAMATRKCAVYEPPVASLPYLVVVFFPDGTLQVQPFASAEDAEVYAEQVAPQGTRVPD